MTAIYVRSPTHSKTYYGTSWEYHIVIGDLFARVAAAAHDAEGSRLRLRCVSAMTSASAGN